MIFARALVSLYHPSVSWKSVRLYSHAFDQQRIKMDLSKIAANQLKPIGEGQTTTLGDQWKNDTCVIVFLRRWGCVFCRLWAKEISEIAPILKKHDVKLMGVGVEDFGAEEFKDGNFFDGDLYISKEKTTYSSLGFKRFSYISVLASLLWKESRDAATKSKKLGITGNLKGDGLQSGGLLIVGKGGTVLTHFIQEGPAEHLSNSAILKALKLDSEIVNLSNAEEADVVTSAGECKRT